MSKILTSLHGKLIGLDDKARLVVPGGFVAGENGNQMSYNSPTNVVLFDDFVGAAVDTTKWTLTEGTDSATSAAAYLAGGAGGILRMTTGDAGSGLAADTEQLTSALQWKAANGGLVFQVRLALSAITTCWAYVGFTDVATGLEAPVISAGSGDTFTTTATDCVGFIFDTRQTNDTWWLVGAANGVVPTPQNTGVAPVAAAYATFRIEVSAAGNAVFFINGNQVGTSMTLAVTPTVALCPIVAVSKTSVAASMSLDLDYIQVAATR